MRTIGNFLWFLFGGLVGGLVWCFAGLLLCISVVGIPLGTQCFKFAEVSFFPFRKEIVYGGGGVSFIVNIIWILVFGWEMAVGYLALGLCWCISIVGIPWGMQCFKLARLALMPFGAQVVDVY